MPLLGAASDQCGGQLSGGQLSVGQEMHGLCSPPGLQRIPWGRWGGNHWKPRFCFSSVWRRGSGVQGELCEVSFDYYPDGSFQIQPAPSLFCGCLVCVWGDIYKRNTRGHIVCTKLGFRSWWPARVPWHLCFGKKSVSPPETDSGPRAVTLTSLAFLS